MKFLNIKFTNGEVYQIGLRHIAEIRAKYYADKDGFDNEEYLKVWKYEFAIIMENDSEAMNWAKDNMDWKDVERYAKKINNKGGINYEEEWRNSKTEIVDEK
jgi:hypothetical protein